MRKGRRYFDEQHLDEVAKRYRESKGKASSIYRYDKASGTVIEFVNTYQCSQLWVLGKRQTDNVIASGKVSSIKMGRGTFVERTEAERYNLTY